MTKARIPLMGNWSKLLVYAVSAALSTIGQMEKMSLKLLCAIGVIGLLMKPAVVALSIIAFERKLKIKYYK